MSTNVRVMTCNMLNLRCGNNCATNIYVKYSHIKGDRVYTEELFYRPRALITELLKLKLKSLNYLLIFVTNKFTWKDNTTTSATRLPIDYTI